MSPTPRHEEPRLESRPRTIGTPRWDVRGCWPYTILDNYGTHSHDNVVAWLDKHPRFHLHFIPTSS